MTTGKPVYAAKLLAQIETWAQGLPAQGRFFAVAGQGTSEIKGEGLIVEGRCSDGFDGIACKEERILEEGYNRGAAWLVVLGEDNYVDTELFEKALDDHAPSPARNGPAALGIVGCGEGTDGYCPQVAQSGGFCGGGGYAINQAALKLLMGNGSEGLQDEYLQSVMPGDMATSCALRRRGVKLTSLPGLGGNRVTRLGDWRQIIASGGLMTYHYCTPDVMYWLHAIYKRKPQAVVKKLEAVAFPDECCCQYRPNPDIDPGKCSEGMYTTTALQVPGRLPHSWVYLTLAYVKQRNEQLASGRPSRIFFSATSHRFGTTRWWVQPQKEVPEVAPKEVPEVAPNDNEMD